MGRPTKRTPELEERLQEALKKGLPRWAASAYAGISVTTFKNWLEDEEFLAQVLEWEAFAMDALVEAVKKEPKGNQYLLGRRFRADYGDKIEVETKGEQKITIEVIRDRLDPKRPVDEPANPPADTPPETS